MYFCLNRATVGGGMPLEQFVQLAADSGFAGADVDLSYGVSHGAAALRDLFASRNLRFGGWGLPDWRSDIATHSKGLDAQHAVARIAGELKIDSCATWIMPSSDLPFIDNWNFHVERLTPYARVLADHGLRLGLEFVAPYHLRRKFKHEFIFTPGLMLELADAVGPNVGLLVDSFHCHTSATTWEHLAQIHASRIVLAHINDAPKRPLHEIQDGERLLPGEGGIELRGFLNALQQGGYDGPVSVEVFSADLRQRPPEEAARMASNALQRMVS